MYEAVEKLYMYSSKVIIAISNGKVEFRLNFFLYHFSGNSQ